jgi:hypothetical protein
VNLILFGLWVGARHALCLDGDGFAAAASAAAVPNGIVREIRALRRRLRGAESGDIPRLRRALLQMELAAERQVQRRLALHVAAHLAARRPPCVSGDRRAAACANLARCLGDENGSPEAAVLRRQFAALTRSP